MEYVDKRFLKKKWIILLFTTLSLLANLLLTATLLLAAGPFLLASLLFVAGLLSIASLLLLATLPLLASLLDNLGRIQFNCPADTLLSNLLPTPTSPYASPSGFS